MLCLCALVSTAPGSAPYEVITAGGLPADHIHRPPTIEGDTWQPAVRKAYESAYIAAGVDEPNFTNLAQTKGQKEPFVGTLDYIFLSRGDWTVVPGGVRSLPHRDAVLPTCSSYPTATEPSDHVAIWADVALVPPQARQVASAAAGAAGAA